MAEAMWRVVWAGPSRKGYQLTGPRSRADAERFAAQVRRLGGSARIVRLKRGRL